MDSNFPPPYEIPLSSDELALMGTIAVMWGQIDEGFNTILRMVLHLNTEVLESLLGNQMIGARLNHLKAVVKNPTDQRKPKVQELLIALSDQMSSILPRRNAAMHGCWGRFPLDPMYQSFKIGTFNHQKPNVRFFAADLGQLYIDMVEILRVLGNLRMLSIEDSPEPIEWNRQRHCLCARPPSASVENFLREG